VQDVIDYTRNGASLIQIGSALVSEGIEIFAKLKAELKEYLQITGIQTAGKWWERRISDKAPRPSLSTFPAKN